MRRLLVLALASALGSSALAAQGLQDASVLLAPTFTELSFGSGPAKRTVSQVAVPLVFILPFGERLSVDVSTAYATSTVSVGGATTSEINGLTDTQVRANLRLGIENLMLTVGLNLPTGQYSVPEDQAEAAGQIGNDFLYYPISSMGNGFAGTGGIAYARPAGEWNLGFGASGRKSAQFTAFTLQSSDFRFTPADEYRLRMSADRPAGSGQVSFGLSYSMFGDDFADTTTYSTGDRIILNGGWSFPVRGSDVFISGWNLYRLKGEVLGDLAPEENVFNVSGAVSIPTGRFLVQPSAEVRLWQVGGVRAGNLANLGVRMRIPVGKVGLFPSVGYSLGTVFSTTDGSSTDVSGLRGSLTIRLN